MMVFLKRDFQLFVKQPLMLFQSALFFVMAVVIYPFLIGSDVEKLSLMSAAILLASFIFAGFVRFGQMFEQDYQDTSLRQIYLAKRSFCAYLAARCLSYWFFIFLPLMLLWLGLKTMVYFPPIDNFIVFGVLVLMSSGFIVLDMFFSALALFVKTRSFVFFTLALPFFLPFVIFSAMTLQVGLQGLPTQGFFYVLLALNFMIVPVLGFLSHWVLVHLMRKAI